MSNSAAEKQCQFIDLTTDEIGKCGATFHLDRTIRPEDIGTLIGNATNTTKRAKERMTQAHQSETKRALTPAAELEPDMLWPYYVTRNREKHTGKLRDGIWKGIGRTPGKARHDNFHLAIFGRLPKEWTETLISLIELILINRTMPKYIKQCTRIPIPKKVIGETRPLAICHDIFCYLSGVVGNNLQTAMNKSNKNIKETVAFQKGKGCDDITHLIAGIREEALEHDRRLMMLFEDEEKFYDRTSLELQIAALKRMGCPDHGYVEFKADDMDSREVHILTSIGTTKST